MLLVMSYHVNIHCAQRERRYEFFHVDVASLPKKPMFSTLIQGWFVTIP